MLCYDTCRDMERVNFTDVADVKDPLVAEVEHSPSSFQLLICIDFKNKFYTILSMSVQVDFYMKSWLSSEKLLSRSKLILLIYPWEMQGNLLTPVVHLMDIGKINTARIDIDIYWMILISASLSGRYSFWIFWCMSGITLWISLFRTIFVLSFLFCITFL